MLKLLKKLTGMYLAFGLGIIVGAVIASTVAGMMFNLALSQEQLERLNEVAQDFKEE
jgi:uncharacterized membrane protein (DUF106 family)